MVKKIMFIRFDMIHERDRQTDRHSMMAQAALMHSIARQKLHTIKNVIELSLLTNLKNLIDDH